MARRVTEGQVAAASPGGQVPVPHTRRRYPWGEWADGEWWLLTQGHDFAGDLEAFRTTVYGYARRNGLRVVTRATGDGILIRFTGAGAVPSSSEQENSMKIELPSDVVSELQVLADHLKTDLAGALRFSIQANAGAIERETQAAQSGELIWTLADGTPVEPYLEAVEKLDQTDTPGEMFGGGEPR